MKIGILVVAYNAETTLVDVLDRIPVDLRSDVAEVLVQDDHSTDDTFAVAATYLERGSDLPLTVVRHPANLGYGGNQKAGYHYAIQHGWDVVVLLHGDGQYAPEVMDRLIRPIVEGNADAVFGSRMLAPGGALEGGMPRYKYLGNRILTTMQNRLTGLSLSEWHSGYRVYRVQALAELPFRTNSDGFDFDTEIILQLLAADKRILEVPIPTYYGDEICRVNGIAYAAAITIDTVRHRVGRSGFGAGTVGHVDTAYAHKPTPNTSHGRIVDMMRERPPARVLDVGCGPGWVARELEAMGHVVTGVDLVEDPDVRSRMTHFVQADLDGGLPEAAGDGFDVVIAADVIEHVRAPERLLSEMRDRMRPGGVMLASVPNFAHWYPRLRTALGRFDYDQRGILDATHLRFFTRRSFLRAVRAVGLVPVAHRHTGLPFEAVGLDERSPLVRAAAGIDAALVDFWPTLFAYQYVYQLAPPAQPIR